ncbi:glycoside hydrolase family 9 protein [Streptomyces sp. NPDC049881]|uniref:glycoside hydrolase family 9 protein n=1 Tax=Streptomyces sp. NPDC049881 TaxID=3155778 RepID=UPI00341C84C8
MLGIVLSTGLAAGALAVPALATPAAAEGPELIDNGDFSGGTDSWWWTEGSPATVVDGRLCVDVPAGTANPWDAILGQDGLPLTAGESYELSYTASSTAPITIRTNVQLAVDPWTTELASPDQIGTAPETVSHTFTASADNTAAQLAFQIGGNAGAYTFCVDDVSLTGGAEPPVYEPDTGSPVRVNQVGYLTTGPKEGTFVTEATAAQGWSLRDADGTQVATGTTTPRGVDPISEQNVHTFDFSSVTEAGDGYTVVIGEAVSEPFSIGDGLYDGLRDDALAFFYHQRSGIAIDAALVGQEYARPAGHANVAPNQGDDNVPCQPGVCDYRLDAAGGWYDAGDHGKYVVNGGISVAQLLSAFERDGAELGDSSLAVPERGNGVPDLLDEARWELDFLTAMQVPAGEELAGMAHHKLHDRQWTALPTRPDQDTQLRELHPPSTAATLNLAAAAAQGARLFEPYDAAYAAELLDAAETAWDAALAHPAVYADPNDATGGGAYSDNDVSDEFFWAAAELFITTGGADYRQAVTGSELWGDGDALFPSGGFSWGSTAALGALDLATVDNGLSASELASVRSAVTGAADGFADSAQGAAYGLPLAPEDDFVWGSNSQVLNNVVVLATAYDLTEDAAYRDAALTGLDYILGRNPLNLSYVTGYGERDVENQHHRFWANQLNASLPHPPAGSLAGGPNSALQDPIAEDLLQGCAPAMCYVDHIESYATNEVTVNWNAPLAWAAAWADSVAGDDGEGPGEPGDPAECEVSYVTNRWQGGFSTQVTVANTGSAAVSPWELRWSFADAQRITQHWNSAVTQNGRDVTARPAAWNGSIPPGGSVNFGFNGTVTGAAADPTAFTLNGQACDVG